MREKENIWKLFEISLNGDGERRESEEQKSPLKYITLITADKTDVTEHSRGRAQYIRGRK